MKESDAYLNLTRAVMVCLVADGDVSLFCQSEINFLAITTWENEDVMRK